MPRSIGPIALAIPSLAIVTAVAISMASQPVRDAYQSFYFIESLSAFMCL